jgi:hypothetical protein
MDAFRRVTPRIDKSASEGIRFTSYTVESQCTPTRSAILTGRQSVRSGTFKVPYPGEGEGGLSPCSRTRVTRRRCGVSGISARSRAGCQPTRGSTSGGATRTASMRPAIRRTRRSGSWPGHWELSRQNLGGQEGPDVYGGVRTGPEGASRPGRVDRREGH